MVPSLLAVADAGAPVPMPGWTAIPFVLLLLGIAVVPLAFGSWWHPNRNKALFAALLSLPVVAYLGSIHTQTSGASLGLLGHELGQYVSFIILLTAMYTVSGGIVLRGDLLATPLVNASFLAVGALLSNLIGTTGASMLLIRAVLQTNRERANTRHIPVFFIFIVSNLSGLLTPLGDPPLFLGFLNGVPFGWTLSLWPQWLLANGVVLGVFFVWDTIAYGRESPEAIARDIAERTPLHVWGLINVPLLAGIILAVVMQSPRVGQGMAGFFGQGDWTLTQPWGEIAMLAVAALSLLLTAKVARTANEFSWGPIVEVAILFAGIFVTMVPALALLRQHGGSLGVREPWQYFWLSGGLSSVLDNAPTYLTFANLALAEGPATADLGWLSSERGQLLAAISCGAVFMGANTYIGNGPNFMVKAIAEEAGYRMPSFFSYMMYSGLVLLPVFVLITLVFFR